MPDKKLPISEFAAKIKSKYPQYGNLSDTDLVTKITNTYPKYKDMVDLSGISKKKELSEPVSPVGGETGISVPPSGFEELKPAKRQPTEVIKEPKVVGEDTLLARKMEREQRPVVSTTGVKLPAAPKVVAEEKAAERALAPKLPTAPKEDIGELEGLSNAIDRGILQGKLADMLALGQMPKREDIKEIARINKELTQIPSTGAYQRFNAAPDLKTAAKEFVDNPFEITSQLISESLSALVRHGYSRALAGAGTGAALGSLIPIPGISTAAGAGTGYIAGMGVAGYNLEMASSIMDSFREAGVDVTDEKSLTKAFDDPNTLRKAREFANKRAVPIAIFDMFSAGMGGKLLGKPAKTILSKVGRGAAEVGIQMGMAGAGETAAQLTAGQKINPTAILAEVIGEAGGGAPDIIVGTMIENKKNNQSIRKEAVRLDIEPQQLQDMLDISEASGEITDAQANEIKKEYEDIQKVKQAVPEEFKKNADVIEALNRKRQLEAKKQGLDPVFAKKIDEQIKALDTKIDDIVAAGEVAPEMVQYTMEAPRLAGEPEQISKPIELSIEPQVPAAEEKTYRVEYFDPESRKMTHQMFATEAEGEAFKKTLTREQTSQGVTSYFEKAPARGVGEVAPEAAPQVPAAPEKINAINFAKKLEPSSKTIKNVYGDIAQNYINKDGVEVTLKDDLEGGSVNGVEVQGDVQLDFIGNDTKRGEGLATKELNRIIEEADKNNISISLVVDSDQAVKGTKSEKGLSNEELKKWYESKGFIFNKDGLFGYRPKKSEDSSIYKIEKYIAKKGEVNKNNVNYLSSPQDLQEYFNSGNLEEGSFYEDGTGDIFKIENGKIKEVENVKYIPYENKEFVDKIVYKEAAPEVPAAPIEALKDVESTTKALEEANENDIAKMIFPETQVNQKVYHGGENKIVGDFKNLNPNLTGFYFSSDINNAKTYGNEIVKAYVDIKKPLIIDTKGLKFTDDIPVEAVFTYPNEKPYTAIINLPIDDIVYAVKNGKRPNEFFEIKNRKEYDGIIFKNLIDPALTSRREIPQDTIVAFENSQIKRADNKSISEAYHKAKKDGNNPELVKAVEDLLVGEVAPEAAPEVPAAPVQELKEGQQIQFNLPANQGQKTGTKVTVPGYEDVDFVAVQDGFNYDIYELASGLKVTPTTSFSVDDAISQTAVTLASKGVTGEKLLSKIYNSEKAIKSLKINESPAIEKFKEKRIAEEEKVPFIHTEEERERLFEIAKEAKEKGLSSAENIITNAANIKSGNKMNEERARAIIATSEKNKKFRDLEEQQKPYPQEDIVKREDTEEDFKQQINNEYKSDKYDTIPQGIKEKGYDAHRKLIEITNKYGYYPKSIKELKADPVIALSIYLRATGAKKVETRADRIKAAEKVVDDTVNSINKIYNREFPEKAVGEVAPEAAPEVPAAPAEGEVSDKKFWDEYGKSDYSYGQYGGKSSDTLYIRDRKSGKVVKEIKIKNEDFDGAKKEVFKWIDSKSGTKILEAYEEVYGEPELPSAPEKTQDEVAKEQTKETDLLLGGQAEQRRKDGKYTKDGVEYVRNPKGQGIASKVTGEVRFTNEVSLPFKYKLVEAETLQPSHQDGIRNPLHFIPEAQPKNRNDVGSLQAEESFANNPRFSELGENTNAYSGAPVVNERGEVVQGNNRSAGLRKGYQRNNPQYKNDLAANAEQFGFTRDQVEGMKSPILVREVEVNDQGAVELGNYDVKDLETGGKRRIDPIAVTRRMPFDVKGRIAELFTGDETLNQAIRANQKRLIELINPYLNQAQRNTITQEGVLTDAGIKDMEAVVQQFLFDNGDANLPSHFEKLSATQKEGLRKSLPYIFSVGVDKSLISDIQEAITAISDFEDSRAGDFDAWLAQGDIFEGKTPRDIYTPLELKIAKILADAKTQKEIVKNFSEYAEAVKGKEADMFEPAKEGKSREEAVEQIFKVKYYEKPVSSRVSKEIDRKEKPTPEPSPEKRAGDAARSLAERIRAGKITRKGLQVSTGLDAIWDAALEVVATSLEAGASIADAIQDGIRYIRSTDFYKNATNKKQIEDNFANQLNEEYNAIQEPTAGKVPVQPKARAGEKVEAGVPPARPPKAPKEEGETEGRKEERRFSKTLIESPELLKAVKKGVGATLEYTRQANAMSVAQAQEILDVLGEDKAYNAMKDEKTNGAVRTVLGQVLIKRYNELAKKATSKEDKDLYIDTTIDIAEYVTKKLATEAGQTIQAFSLWEALTPEAQLVAAVKEVKKSARANVGKVRKDIDNLGEKFNKANEEAIKEILKSEEVDRSVKKDAQEGVQKAKDRAAKARQKRADIIKKYKGKGGITLTTGGLTKEGIEFVGEVAVTYIEEGLAEVQVIAEKILADIKTITGSSPNDKVRQEVFEIAEKELSKSDLKVVKSVKDQRLKINEIAIKHFTEVEKIKKDLAQKFVDEADMSEDNAEDLAKRFEDAFDRVVSRKKAEILAKNKKRFDRIQKAINEQAGKKAEKKTLQDEIIKYSNLGAFTADDMLDFLAKKFNIGQLTTEQAAKIEELAQKIQKAPEGSPKREATEDLLAYQASLNKGNWGEVAQGIWYANILSGYRTHEKNIVSTFFNSLADLGTEVIADPKGAPYLIAGYMQGVGKKGMLEAMRTLKTGRSPIHIRAVEIPDILERKKFVGGGYNPANWFKYVGRAMKAEDVLSFQGLKEARAWQLARREAEKYGFNTWTRSGWQKVNELLLNTTERFEMAKDQALEEGLVENSLDYKRRIYELMENSRPEAMTEDAYNFAAHGTYNYNSDGTLGAVTNAISKSVLDVKIGGVQPGRFVVPFTRIITNVVNNALDYSPVGLVRAAKGARGFKSFDEVSITKGAYKPLTPEQRRVVAIKAAVGISFAAIIQYMVSAGLIDMSGEGPEDEKKKAQLREQGWQPYSIKIGDTWYSYFYTPLILTLGWMGNLNDAAKYGGEDEETLLRRASIASLKFGGMIADMTWINSAATFLGALTEPRINEQQRRVENALSGMARGFVPFAQNITQLTQAYNSTFQIPAKQVNNSWEALYQDIPIARNSLNDKVNALGEPVIKDIDIMWSKEKGSPVWSFLTNKKGWVATLNRKTVLVFDQKLRQDRPLTDNEFYELSKLRGRYIKEDIERIMKEGYPVKREGAIKIVLGEDMTPKELNNILSKRIEPLATKKAKAKIFGFEYSEKEDDELNAELTELEREYWGLNEN